MATERKDGEAFMKDRPAHPELTENECRKFFCDIICPKCGDPASVHGLNGIRWSRTDKCVWTWQGAILSAFAFYAMQPRSGDKS